LFDRSKPTAGCSANGRRLTIPAINVVLLDIYTHIPYICYFDSTTEMTHLKACGNASNHDLAQYAIDIIVITTILMANIFVGQFQQQL
jgi:hypothetical protein